MTILNTRQMVDAETEGKVRNYMWRKNPSQANSASLWFDLSMSPGNPTPKYWFDAPPYVAKVISQSLDGGVYHGANVSPSTKYLRRITTLSTNSAPITFLLCDYLLYYPSIDDSTLDEQFMDNTVRLSRSTDGAGVQIVAINVASRTGLQRFYVTYTNSDGVSGRTSKICQQNIASAIGTVVTSGLNTPSNPLLSQVGNPFIPLQDGDTGVRQIDSLVMLGTDVGLMTLILVKPIAQTSISEFGTGYEKDFYLQAGTLPIIQDDAFLGFLCLPMGTINTTSFLGDLKVIWG